MDTTLGDDPLAGTFTRRLGQVARRVPLRKTPILISGHGRSGTTWIGRTLDLVPEVLYTNEPANPGRWAGADVLGPYRTLDPVVPSPFHERAFGFAFDGVAAPGRSWGSKRDWVRRFRGDVQVVVKDVQTILSMPWLLQRWPVRLLVPFRHPGAIMLSQLERRTNVEVGIATMLADPRIADRVPDSPVLSATGTREQAAAASIAIRMFLLSEDVAQVDGALEVRYEDLAGEPVDGFRQIFDWAGLDCTDDIEAEIRRNTSADDPAEYGVVKDAAYRSARWRDELPADAAVLMRRAVETVGLRWQFDW